MKERERAAHKRPDMAQQVRAAIRYWMASLDAYSRLVVKKALRAYQREPGEAIVRSVLGRQGHTFAVMMARQAGKNELSGQLEAYLLNLYQRAGGQIVKASPTFKPQTINSILRLCDRIDSPWTQGRWRRREGYMVQLGRARCLFFSADPQANVVGGTADLLLECDEAQDVRPDKWDKDFVPMGASTHATTVFWGTAWTADTMLAQQIAHLQALERRDGLRRVYRVPADVVSAEVPAYGAHVADQVARLGRQHPIVKTQYYLETIDGQGGFLNAQRRALMRGDHPRRHAPEPGHRYALLIDVAGEDEAEGEPVERALLRNKRRDATALTVVDVETGYGQRPNYRVVDRRFWLGHKHAALYARILALAQHWRAVWVVVDATGVGAGLASFLGAALGDKLIAVVFSPKVKSQIGWDFLGIVETGRYRDYYSAGIEAGDAETRQFWYEAAHCEFSIRSGPSRTMRWGVWETPAYDGRLAHGHDDLLVSAALCAILDGKEWPGTGESAVVEVPDPLGEVDGGRW